MIVEWAPDRVVEVIDYGGSGRTLLLAHGAGTDQRHRLVSDLAAGLVAAGWRVLTFDYPYRAEGRRPPDRTPVLLACHRAVFETVSGPTGTPPVLAGRSMGGRVGTMLAAEGLPVPAVIAYGYPLHPADAPERLRVEHLAGIKVPALFVRGERDALARPDLFDLHIRSHPGFRVVDVPGDDHSLGRSTPALVEATVEFLAGVKPWG